MLSNKLRIGASGRSTVAKPSSRAFTVRVQATKNAVSESYAKALVDLSQEKGKLTNVHSDMEGMLALLEASPALKELLGNPVVDSEKKRQILNKLGKDAEFNEYTNNFLNLLNVKDRLSLLDEICESFEKQYSEITDTQIALVRSAVALDKEQETQISARIQKLSGAKNVKVKASIDESLIGGFVVEFGSTQIDLSVRGQIERVAESLNKDMVMNMA